MICYFAFLAQAYQRLYREKLLWVRGMQAASHLAGDGSSSVTPGFRRMTAG